MKKSYLILLNSISIIIFLLTIFHLAFWEILNWEVTLACLNANNRNIMYALNIISIMNFFAMVIITTFYRFELLNTGLGKFILLWFSSLGILRVILEFILWNESPNFFIITICLFIGIIYSLPLWMKKMVWPGK
jgi:hypothetical protein